MAAEPLAKGELQLHPAWVSNAANAIAVEVRRPGPEGLILTYALTCDRRRMEVPADAARGRRDELWRRTCFEAFLNVPGRPDYYEFNFAPSTEWAAYVFDGYRTGMRDAAVDPPLIQPNLFGDEGEVRVAFTLPQPLRDAPLRLGLAAVILAVDGTRSYWALAHPPGKADFHHPDGFVLNLPAP